MRSLVPRRELAVLGVAAAVIGAGISTGGCREVASPPPRETAPSAADQRVTGVEAAAVPRGESYGEADLGQERKLAPAEAHRYRIDLDADRLLHVEVDQRGVDVYLRLWDPGDRLLLRVDSRNQDRGPEHLYAVTTRNGMHTLEVRAFDDTTPGAYLARIEQRPAAEEDRRHAEAEKAFADAFALVQARPRTVPEQAVAGFRRAAEIWKGVGNSRRWADALFELAPLYRDADRWSEALTCYERALPFFPDSRNRAVILNEIARLRQDTGAPTRARQSFEQALDLFRELGDRWNEASVLHNLGRLDSRQGRALDALEHLRQARERWIDLGEQIKLAETLNGIGEVYERLGETSLALDHHRQALELQDPRASPLDRANTLCFMGRALFEADELDPAAERFARCLELRQEGGAPETDQAKAWAGLGAVEVRRGRPRRALELFQRALAVFERRGSLVERAILLDNVAWLYNDQGETGEALSRHRQAVEIFRRSTHHEGEAMGRLGVAVAHRRRGEAAEALENAEKALALIERVVESGQAPARRKDLILPYFASRQLYFDFYVDLLMEQHRRQPEAGYDALALATSEQARARHLLQVLAETPGALQENADPALLEEQRRLREEINAADRELRYRRGIESEESLAEAERRQRWRWAEYHRLAQRIVEESSWHASLHQPRPLALPGIQRLLDDRTLLLEYHLGDDRSFLWTVDPSRMESHELPPRAVIESLARRTHRELTRSDQLNYRGPTERDLSRLSEILLRPVAEKLAGQRLLIVASGALESIPFAALPVPASPDRRLVEEHEILHVPSASVLAMLRGRRDTDPRMADGLLAVVADAVYDPEDPRLDGREPTPDSLAPRSDALRRIPYSGHEAEAIRTIAESRGAVLSALGFEARRELATDGRLDGYRIVHFATHGIFREDHAELSALILSRYDADGRPVEGRLSLSEIYGLDLSAELVVLSACQSALGREIRGEGMMGLPRGFLYAGATRVLASLWKVQDESTAELMTRFYRHLLVEGLAPAAALREAQRSMLADPRYAPYHWAGFVLQGDWF